MTQLLVSSKKRARLRDVADQLRALGFSVKVIERFGVISARGDPDLLKGVKGIEWRETSNFQALDQGTPPE